MADIIWSRFDKEKQNEYTRFLKIFGALSGLFKDIETGAHAKKPYLYYRNHEQLYARAFKVEDLTRRDSAFDALAHFGGEKIGVGLKTWFHSGDKSFQKVAEFNKLAKTDILPLLEEPQKLVKKIGELRNARIMLDKREFGTTSEIYHYITRSDGQMNILETKYDLVQLDSIKNVKCSSSGSVSFTDGCRNYRFTPNKSTLFEEFNSSDQDIITKVRIEQFDNPFELLDTIVLAEGDKIEGEDNTLYLPIYSDASGIVEEKSGFNAWNAKPKTKGSNIPRPDFEAYIPIPAWIHKVHDDFFGVDVFDKKAIKNSEGFNLHLPDGRCVIARITQENGKSLQTNPQSVLGKWILKDVLGLQARELLTKKHLDDLGVDSLKITRIDKENFKICLAETNAFERWKLDNTDKIEELATGSGSKKIRMPKLRQDWLEDAGDLFD